MQARKTDQITLSYPDLPWDDEYQPKPVLDKYRITELSGSLEEFYFEIEYINPESEDIDTIKGVMYLQSKIESPYLFTLISRDYTLFTKDIDKDFAKSIIDKAFDRDLYFSNPLVSNKLLVCNIIKGTTSDNFIYIHQPCAYKLVSASPPIELTQALKFLDSHNQSPYGIVRADKNNMIVIKRQSRETNYDYGFKRKASITEPECYCVLRNKYDNHELATEIVTHVLESNWKPSYEDYQANWFLAYIECINNSSTGKTTDTHELIIFRFVEFYL